MAVPRFWRELSQRYNLIGCKCGKCGKIYYPKRIVCSNCGRESIGRMNDYKLEGEGEVITYTIVHSPMRGFELQVPYVIAIIRTTEGVNILGQIIDCEPEDVKIGMRVEPCFRKISEDGKAGMIHYGYKFRPL